MAVKKTKDLGVTWQCDSCNKWNFGSATTCWKCQEPKYPEKPKPKRGRPKKELANAQ